MVRRRAVAIVWGVVVGLAVAGCGSAGGGPASPPTLAPGPPIVDSQGGGQGVTAEAATPPPAGFWVQPGVPEEVGARAAAELTRAGLVRVEAADRAALRVVLDPGPEAVLTAQWVYTVVAPFPTVADDVSWAALGSYWRGEAAGLPGFEVPPRIVITADVADVLIARLGPPAEGLPLDLYGSDQADQLSALAWDARPAIGVVSFGQLEPSWKVLTLDGASVLDKALDVEAYPLTVRVGVVAGDGVGAQAVAVLQQAGAWQSTNRDPGRVTIITVTGVTALARATAMQMELQGNDFPAREIMPFLADADILHTSNESSFAADCPEPEWTGPPKFCSQRDYFALLQAIGLDVVELTGNHNNDWGIAAFNNSLDIYEANGVVYYGGGRDLEDSKKPRVLLAPDGTRVAFIGCNSAGPYTAWATEATPGAAPCEDWGWMVDAIGALKAGGQADVVIATVQYQERDSYEPSDQQVADFERLAAAGADIVSGSQAHQPQGFSFAGGRFIHYGVGNLFFDQMDYIENRQMFADKHVLYEGRHISTVLFSGMMEYWAQPRPMTPEERAAFLKLIFERSGW